MLPPTVFGFAAALLEGLPIIGLIFTISNRIGAAMWAHGKMRCLILVSHFMLGPKGSNFLFFLYMRINRLSQIWRNVNTISAPCGVHEEAGLFRRETARKSGNQRSLQVYQF